MVRGQLQRSFSSLRFFGSRLISRLPQVSSERGRFYAVERGHALDQKDDRAITGRLSYFAGLVFLSRSLAVSAKRRREAHDYGSCWLN